MRKDSHVRAVFSHQKERDLHYANPFQNPPAMLVVNSFSFKPSICYTKKLMCAKLYVRLATVHK